MREAEHDADETTHALFKRVNTTFVTPFDREDIYRLGSGLDDVMDMMDEAVDLVLLYEVEGAAAGAVAAGRGAPALRRAHRRGDAGAAGAAGSLEEYWIEINRLENAGDKNHRRILAKLFSGEFKTHRGAQAEGHRRLRSRARSTPSRGGEHRRADRRQGDLSPMELAIVIAVVVVALAFDYTNGFHDAANAIATSVSTRALTPRVALILAAVMNFVGALLGQEVAKTVAERDHHPPGLGHTPGW